MPDPTDRPPLRLEYRDAASLRDNPENWKAHPADQVSGFDALFSEVGWAGAALLNERTGKLLDGHMRKGSQAARTGPVPVLVGNWTDEQERAILAYLDPIGWTAVSDRKKLTALLAGPFPDLQNEALQSLMGAVKGASKLLDPTGPDPSGDPRDDELSEVSIPLDSLWPSDNPWSVPSLLPELQADQVPGPVTTWGTIGARRPMAGTWHFFTADRKFEPLWKRPHRVLYSRPAACVEPNFSTTDQTPFALNLWNTYRKRWIARYFQASGLRIFVDLNVDAAMNAPSDAIGGRRPNLLGVPCGWNAYASRAHGNNPDALVSEWGVAREHSGRDHPLFLVVGGGKRVKALAAEHGWVWVPEQIATAHAGEDAAAAE
jgi:Domain of unknown function (DUF4417)